MSNSNHHHQQRLDHPAHNGNAADDDGHHQHQHQLKKMPPFITLFIKCPLLRCIEFRLREVDIVQHLQTDHHIFFRCVATERCVREEMSFDHGDDLARHLAFVHNDITHGYRCYICGRKCGEQHDKLVRHLYNVHEEGHFACPRRPRCGFTAMYRQLVIAHYDQVHGHSF